MVYSVLPIGGNLGKSAFLGSRLSKLSLESTNKE